MRVAKPFGLAEGVASGRHQERPKEFWTTAVGFDLVRDKSYGDERCIEVQPPATPSGFVLSRRAHKKHQTRGTQRAALERLLHLRRHPANVRMTADAGSARSAAAV